MRAKDRGGYYNVSYRTEVVVKEIPEHMVGEVEEKRRELIGTSRFQKCHLLIQTDC